MAQFKNVTDGDLEIYVDGFGVPPIRAAAGETFDVPDEHADRLRLQPHFKEIKAGKAKEPAKGEEGTD